LPIIAEKAFMQKITEKIHALFLPIFKRQDVDFVDLEIHGSAKNLVIKVFADVPGGIKIGECAALSSELRDELEIANIIQNNGFRLEVSSPGLDRPLKTNRDFFRNIGRYAEFTLGQEMRGGDKIAGEIVRAEDDRIEIRIENEELVEIPLENVKRAMLQIKWA